MTAEELFKVVCDKARDFGMNAKNNGRTIIEPKGNAVIRKNLLDGSFKEGGAYFGFLSPEEDTVGPYFDFSFVILPDSKDNVQTCVVCLAVGSSGFRNDYQLAVLPGLRRIFLNRKNKDTFFKTAFDDIESTSTDLLKEIRINYPQLRSVVENYKTVLPATCIINIQKDGLQSLFVWLATYAKIRSWGTAQQKKAIEKILAEKFSSSISNEEQDIKLLLKKRKYVVLQGAPGTGKTYTSLIIAKEYDKTFFDQFHAETNYSDVVFGIEPSMSSDTSHPQFKQKQGILYKAIDYAEKHQQEKVLLIIDEINRANLSNVLGPIFYLFEYQPGDRIVKIRIGDKELTKLPDNIDVLATMYTADRSLAVVDFALRRRFAWYTLRPRIIKSEPGKKFMESLYNKFADIFFQFASDDELNLQPGQSYFIVSNQDSEAEMQERMIYELMPLIKEYLAEGYLLKAKDAFGDLFLKETGKFMYE